MINDKLRLVDGFRGLPGGMDGSRDPVLTPETSVYYAENIVFRGGAGPRTRPGFHYVDLFGYSAVNSGTGFLTAATTVQCAMVFNSPTRGEPVIVYVADGKVIVVDIVSKRVTYVNTDQNNATVADFTNKTAPCYACQVEEFLVIQDGVSTPRVLVFTNSATLRLNLATYYSLDTPIPVGKQMAYGHGRLFVTKPNGREIVAGDIAFGGSLTSKDIVSSSDDDKAVITTSTNHGWVVGDYITISGHSSLPSINGTFKIESRPATNQFTIASAVGVPGSGGQATKFNAGTSRDALNFSENTFINEGGSFVIPLEMGPVKTMEFLPIQDISTGQGDLTVFGERGAVSFAVSAPRTQWKETPGFQRVLFSNIGSLSETTCTINGDIFFRSREGNGIRSYRNARAEFNSFGQTPISAEMDPIFDKEDLTKLSRVSMIHFDDRLLMTCKPATVDGRLIYKGITAMDFRPVSTNSGKGYAIYDGVWGGLQVVTLVTGVFNDAPRAFALCYHGDGIDQHQLWEITKDEKQDKNSYAPNNSRLISSLMLTKAYDFNSPYSEKKLIHGDLWFSEVGGWNQEKKKFEADLKFRPDSNPNWTAWGNWELCFSETTPRALRGYAPQLRAVVPEVSTNGFTDRTIGRGYDFKLRLEWKGSAKLEKLLVHSLQLVEAVGAGPQPDPNEAVGCVLVSPDGVEETLENMYKAWRPDGETLDYFIQLASGGTDFLCTEDGELIIGYQKYI